MLRSPHHRNLNPVPSLSSQQHQHRGYSSSPDSQRSDEDSDSSQPNDLSSKHSSFPLFAGSGRDGGGRDGGYSHHHHHHGHHHSSQQSPHVATNECRVVEYRGARIAAFLTANKNPGEYLLCLPQAFELFLKHLVGGLHTVYTKLKVSLRRSSPPLIHQTLRSSPSPSHILSLSLTHIHTPPALSVLFLQRLDIVPIVCNVEQVRILRGLGAIQPGVNRCKLLSTKDFDVLFKDCTTAR